MSVQKRGEVADMVVIHKQDDADAACFELSGELTVACAGTLRDELLRLLETHPRLRLDLSHVAELDSSAVQILLWAQREAACRGRTVLLENFAPAVTEVVQLLNLNRVLADSGVSV
jgi:anti-sigma B factor antagonist